MILISAVGFSQNVGIGTNNPAWKLDVKNGSIITDSVYRIKGYTVIDFKNPDNMFVGLGGGISNTGSQGNTSLGVQTLQDNTTGS